MNLKEKRAALITEAQAIVSEAQKRGTDLTPEETELVNTKAAAIRDVDAEIKKANDSRGLLDEIMGMKVDPDKQNANGLPDEGPKSIGEHWRKNAGDRFLEAKGRRGASVSTTEFKAATDTQVTTGSVFNVVLTTVDRTIVQAVRPRLYIADLLGGGVIGPNSNAVTYFIEGAFEGDFATVAETGTKPQMHLADPTTATDALKKIAGFVNISDEMLEDLDYIVSEINSTLLYKLSVKEEQQILSGAGTGSQVLGLLNRSGVQVVARGTLASGDTAPDAIFRGITAVQTGSGLDADAIVIHPTDYQTLRLAKDGNGQYYGGGFFQGQYGNGTITDQPNLWGLRTVVTTAATVGQVVVGSFRQAATLYRKGGVRVESTNSHASNFTSNITTIRVEERVALAVRRPAAFVKVTITPAP